MAIIIKNEEQIDGIRKSCKLAASCLKFITPYVQEGVTTLYLNNLIETYIRDNGAIPAPLNYEVDGLIYPKATCISVNEAICHGIPNDYVLKNGDILNIDVTTILNEFFGDTSIMFGIGEISEDAKKLLNITKECLYIGIQQVKPGNYFSNIGYWIGKYAEKNGFSVVREFTGHGVGILFHEEPQILHISKERYVGDIMHPGMIFTIEPMINQKSKDVLISENGWTATTTDGGLSAQYEHTILVTEDSFEILTLGE